MAEDKIKTMVDEKTMDYAVAFNGKNRTGIVTTAPAVGIRLAKVCQAAWKKATDIADMFTGKIVGIGKNGNKESERDMTAGEKDRFAKMLADAGKSIIRTPQKVLNSGGELLKGISAGKLMRKAIVMGILATGLLVSPQNLHADVNYVNVKPQGNMNAQSMAEEQAKTSPGSVFLHENKDGGVSLTIVSDNQYFANDVAGMQATCNKDSISITPLQDGGYMMTGTITADFMKELQEAPGMTPIYRDEKSSGSLKDKASGVINRLGNLFDGNKDDGKVKETEKPSLWDNIVSTASKAADKAGEALDYVNRKMSEGQDPDGFSKMVERFGEENAMAGSGGGNGSMTVETNSDGATVSVSTAHPNLLVQNGVFVQGSGYYDANGKHVKLTSSELNEVQKAYDDSYQEFMTIAQQEKKAMYEGKTTGFENSIVNHNSYTPINQQAKAYANGKAQEATMNIMERNSQTQSKVTAKTTAVKDYHGR